MDKIVNTVNQTIYFNNLGAVNVNQTKNIRFTVRFTKKAFAVKELGSGKLSKPIYYTKYILYVIYRLYLYIYVYTHAYIRV